MNETLGPLQQLQRELAAGNITQETFDRLAAAMGVKASGSGAIAQGQDALAVGAGGVASGGDISGGVNTGQQITAAPGAQIV